GGASGGRPSPGQIRRAFRLAAKDAHPDADGGSEERFRLVVWAYGEAMAGAPLGGPARRRAAGYDDGFVAAWEDRWREEQQQELGVYHSFEEIERQTDDDGWGDREPLQNFFVWKHDAAVFGGVVEGDVAIYRLSHNIDGRYWGVGVVLAIQATYTVHGPNGIVFLQPLMRESSGGEGWERRLVEDSWAEVASVRVLDRLEVLGSDATRCEDGSIAIDGRSYHRVFESGMVHVQDY
ncbi:unnamed protein product, partial [Prorocentrum cordatum]